MNVGDYKFPGDHPHHATTRRAWCGCGEWCYLATGGYVCACCQRALADANPCTRCDGTGVEPDEGCTTGRVDGTVHSVAATQPTDTDRKLT